MVRAGKLRERVTIQQRTLTSDGMGGESESWSTLATVWASVTPRTGNREALVVAENQIQSRSVYDLHIRYRADVAVTMRVVWRGNTLEIENVVDTDQRTRQLMLTCSAKDSEP